MPSQRHVRLMVPVALALLFSVSGCTSAAYRSLKHESEIARLAPLVRATETAETKTIHVTVTGETQDPMRLAIHKVENGEKRDLVVFVHGVLSDHTTWRFLMGELSRTHDVWAIDLPGSGASDKPKPGKNDDTYSPPWLARCVLKALAQELENRDAGCRVGLVAHSLGGSVVLNAFRYSTDYASVFSRVRGLVLFAPLGAHLVRPDPDFGSIATLSGLEAFLGSQLGILESRVANSIAKSANEPGSAPRREADRIIAILEDSERRKPAQAMISRAIPFNGDTRTPEWEKIEANVQALGGVSAPTLILWGERDENLSVAMGYKLCAHLQDAYLATLPRTKHSIHIERPHTCIRAIRSFMGSPKRSKRHDRVPLDPRDTAAPE